jgi:copper(I)-binding protein
VGARSDAAATVELHTHINDDGVMRMRQVEDIAIPAGGETVLQPGGLHLMLIGLHQPLQPGDSLTLELEFDDGSTRSLTVPVRKIEMGQMGHHHH